MSNIPDDNTTYNASEEQTLNRLRKELFTTRIFCIITSLLMVCVLTGGILVCTQAKAYIEKARPLVEALSTVDFATINDTMEDLDASLNAVDWDKMSEQLGALDMEALNEAIAGLDTKELTRALENLNEASETLEKMSEALKSFLAKFGL